MLENKFYLFHLRNYIEENIFQFYSLNYNKNDFKKLVEDFLYKIDHKYKILNLFFNVCGFQNIEYKLSKKYFNLHKLIWLD
jgi:hypothetical protein